MATAVGLDIGTQSIKVAVMDGSAAKPRLVDFVDHRLDPGQTTRALGPEGLAALLRRIFAERRIPTENVVSQIDAARCLARELQVPFTRDDQIAKTIKFQAESVFHSMSIDEVLVEYYKVEEIRPSAEKGRAGGGGGAGGERSRLIVVALRKGALREHLDLLGEAGIDPAAVDLDVAAIFNAWSRTKEAADGRPTLIVDLGGGSMKVLAIEGGRIRGMRALRAQAAGIRVGEAKKPRVTLDDLRAGLAADERDDAFFMEEEGRLPVVILDEEQSELFDLGDTEEERRGVLEKILLEIDRTLAGTRLDGPIERVFLTGGGAAVEGIEKAFADHFQAPCERLSLRGAFAPRSGRHDPAFDLFGPTAIGLALKGLGHDRTGIDFRKEEFVFAGKFDKAKRGVACALVLLFTFFFLLAYDFQNVELRRLSSKLARLEKHQVQIYWTLFPEEAEKPPPPGGWLAALRRKQSELKGHAVDVPDVVSMLDVLRDVAQGFEESGKKIALKQLSFRQGNANLRGEVEIENIAYDLKDAVNAKPRLATVEIERVAPNKEGKVDVTFKVLAKAPEGAGARGAGARRGTGAGAEPGD